MYHPQRQPRSTARGGRGRSKSCSKNMARAIKLLLASIVKLSSAAAAGAAQLLFFAAAAARVPPLPAAALSRHVPNPKPRHPHGKPPEGGARQTDRAERELGRVRNFIVGGDGGGDDAMAPTSARLRVGSGGTSGPPRPRPLRPHVLVDGNNVRGVLGYDLSGASDLTYALGRWWADVACGSNGGGGGAGQQEQEQPAVAVIVWDGGGVKHPTASMLRLPHPVAVPGALPSPSSVVVVFSGSESSADDVVVQLCGYLDYSRGIAIGGGTPHGHPSPEAQAPIAVFTSDANLASRCVMQRTGNGGGCGRSAPDAVRVFHSQYLAWMVQDTDTIRNRSASPSHQQQHRHVTVPDWEREERRDQARALRLELERLPPDDDEEAERSESIFSRAGDEGGMSSTTPRPTSAALGALLRWFATGCPGVSVGRVTRGGSVLYELEATIGHHLSSSNM